MARQRAGCAVVDVEARTLGDALRRAAEACPGLVPDVVDGDRAREHWRVSLNGERFVTDPATPLRDGDSVLVLSAASGG